MLPGVVAAATVSYNNEILSEPSLTGYWKLNDLGTSNPADSSPNGRTGIYQVPNTRGAAALLSDGELSCDFGGGRVAITFGAWMNTAAITAEAWFNPDTLGSDRMIVIHDQDASPLTELAWRLNLTGNKVQAVANIGSTIRAITGTTTILTGSTYHAAITVTGSTMNLYVNGALEGTGTYTGSLNVASTQDITIGKLAAISANQFDGRIGKVATYNAALSAGRIAAHYAAR